MSALSLITVLYQSQEVLADFFKSLVAQTYQDFDLYIYDNSPDNLSYLAAQEYIQKYALEQQVYLIKNTENVGFAVANNQGIQAALQKGAKYIGIINNDIVFDDPYLLANMLNECQKNPIVVPKMRYFDNQTIWCAGGEFIRYKGIVRHFGDGQAADLPQYNQAKLVEFAPMCFMFIRSELFKTIGLLDEKTFVYYDDADWLWRAKLAGYQVYYAPHLVIDHKVSSSTGGGNSLFTIFYGTRNRLYFIHKHFSWFDQIRSYLFFFSTRIPTYLHYNPAQRTQLIKGIRAGIHLIKNKN